MPFRCPATNDDCASPKCIGAHCVMMDNDVICARVYAGDIVKFIPARDPSMHPDVRKTVEQLCPNCRKELAKLWTHQDMQHVCLCRECFAAIKIQDGTITYRGVPIQWEKSAEAGGSNPSIP